MKHCVVKRCSKCVIRINNKREEKLSEINYDVCLARLIPMRYGGDCQAPRLAENRAAR